MKKVESGTINTLEELDNYLKNNDNLRNAVYISKVPQLCKDEPCSLGIDEAGRGPVLGPMVYGIAFCPISKSQKLEELQCDDSKALNEKKRDTIFSEILKSNDVIGYAVEVISPNTICNSMYSRNKISLNQVSMDAAIGLVRQAIAMGVNIAEIYVDTVGPPEKYQAYLKSLFPAYKITVAKKADSTYPIVSAASICAKVTRDHALQVWVFQEGINLKMEDFGSGYPGDPVTKRFLQNEMDPIFGFPMLVRFSWSTAEKILEEQAFEVEWEDVEDPESPSSQNQSITSFFQPFAATDGGQKLKSSKKKHKFFSERCLKNCTEF